VKPTRLSHLTFDEQAAVMEYTAYIRAQFPRRILDVILFGSKARGDADAESDIDLLVLVDSEDNEFRSTLWRLASDVSLKYDVILSPRVLSQARWVEAEQARFPLYRAVMTEGVPLLTLPTSPGQSA